MHKTLAGIALLGVSVAAVTSAGAAGDTTHGLMAVRSIGYVQTPALSELLQANRDAFRAGAHYPDAGYWARDAGVPGGDFGEVSHWERFINAYVAHVRSKPECALLADPRGPCAPLIAHLMGAAAHGMGDEVWDWLFEPLVTDHGEVPDPPVFSEGELGNYPPGSLITSIEYAMDMVAIVDHAMWADVPTSVPPTADLVTVYKSMERDDITEEGILAAHALQTSILVAERVGAALDSNRIREQMPWSSAHYYTESGGVLWAARAISGYLDALWRKLTQPSPPPPRVVAFHPDHGEEGVPAQWLPARTSPGPYTGGGENRILAVMSNSLDPASVAAAFRLIGPDGEPVAALTGFPRAGPYGAEDGTHSMLFYPASDLQPCTSYTAVVTMALLDHARASPSSDFSWRFRTGPAGGTGDCP